MFSEDANFEPPRSAPHPMALFPSGTETFSPRTPTMNSAILSTGSGGGWGGPQQSCNNMMSTPRASDRPTMPAYFPTSFSTPNAMAPVPPTPKKSHVPSKGKGGGGKRARADSEMMARQIQVLSMGDDGSQESAPQYPAALSQQQVCELSQQTQTFSQSYAPQWTHGYHTDFHELELLGSGSFGRVYVVERRFDGQRFAVKQIVESVCGSKDQMRKLLEVRTMGVACQGPHVVQLHHTWVEGEVQRPTMYILMELCPGGSLENRARTLPPPVEAEAIDILGQLTLALYACHSQSIVHGDIKLENVYYDRKGRLKLGDFGLAAFLDATTGVPISYRQYETVHNQSHIWSSRENTMESWSQDDGDARYIALDMLNERVHLKQGDIFSVGMCMYELMSGKPLPRNGEDHTNLRTTNLASQVLYSTGRYTHVLINLVTSLISPDPLLRPGVEHILTHPLLQTMPGMGKKRDPVVMSLRQTIAECEFYRMELPSNDTA